VTPGEGEARRRSGLFAELVHARQVSVHGGETDAASLIADQPLNWRRFDTWLRSVRIGHAPHILRIKGLLNCAGIAGPLVIQGVEHVMHAPVMLEHWPADDHRSRIVVISRGLPAGTIQQSWNQALPGLLATN
jgi:G3E family GTPase